MDILRTFEVNGKVLKIICNETETTTLPPVLEPSEIVPGTGKFEINSLELSADHIIPGESLSLSAHILGGNIAFIYTEILLKDKDMDLFYGPVAQKYVLAEKEEEVQGVRYPQWETDITLHLNITPALCVLTDGIDSAFAFMHPVTYGHDEYQLNGLFAREGTGNLRRASLKFNSTGEMTGMLVYKEKWERSAPHALTFKPGDQFTPLVQILTCTSAENSTWQTSRGISTTLTWQETAFQRVDETPVAGDYLLGLVIQDMDGEQTRQYIPFTIIDQDDR